MIQEIGPKVFHNEYRQIKPNPGDILFAFRNKEVLAHLDEDGRLSFPEASVAGEYQLQYLFQIDEQAFYLLIEEQELQAAGFQYEKTVLFRRTDPQDLCFAGMTAYHLYTWYRDNRFCGRCGHETEIYETERAMHCPECGNLIYPKIAPAIIVGVTDGTRIVMTRYAGREYKGTALIAGFCEIGETAEDTVRREVMEEVGLEVTDIRYYRSQPWGFDSNLLLGYFCCVKGSLAIHRDTGELAAAEWVDRQEIDQTPNQLSLTAEMISYFRLHPEKFGKI
ncbi:MAG: NAD(+) diphosphatase [Butyrivibrio sp.]|nr:NAD(+) diphosphatase [Butyrivibrio sp.]